MVGDWLQMKIPHYAAPHCERSLQDTNDGGLDVTVNSFHNNGAVLDAMKQPTNKQPMVQYHYLEQYWCKLRSVAGWLNNEHEVRWKYLLVPSL